MMYRNIDFMKIKVMINALHTLDNSLRYLIYKGSLHFI
jgi:hypothetical protein